MENNHLFAASINTRPIYAEANDAHYRLESSHAQLWSDIHYAPPAWLAPTANSLHRPAGALLSPS